MKRLILLILFLYGSLCANAQFVSFYDNGQQLIGPGTGMHLGFNPLTAMMVEHDIPVTEVAVNGDAIGLMYDPSTVNGLIVRQTTSANRPILGSDGTRNNFATFDGTNDYLTILSSLSFFNTFWDVVPKGTFLIWFKMNGGDGVSQMLMSNSDYTVTANDVGFQILRNNSNVLISRATTDQSGVGFNWTYTTTATVTAASGWRGLIISVNGPGASAGRAILIDASGTVLEDNTFAVTAGATVNAQTVTQVGARADATTPDLFCNCSISSIIVENFPVTDNLIEQFKNHNPLRSSEEFTPVLQSQMDMNVNNYIFSNFAGTTVANNGDNAWTIRNNVIGNFNTTPTFGALRRNASADSGTGATTSPKFRTSILNGRSAIEFDGSNDNMVFLNTLFEEGGGKWTFFIVAENQDDALGSHLMRGNNYFAITGASYVGGLTSPYGIGHGNPTAPAIGIEGKNTGSNGPKVFAFTRDGSNFSVWNGNKTKTTITGGSTVLFNMAEMGLAHTGVGSTWNFDGYLFIFKKYNGVMTDAQVEAEIDNLNSAYGLWLIPIGSGMFIGYRRRKKLADFMEETFKQAA